MIKQVSASAERDLFEVANDKKTRNEMLETSKKFAIHLFHIYFIRFETGVA